MCHTSSGAPHVLRTGHVLTAMNVSGESHAGAMPTISFDYFFTKSDGQAGDSGNPDTITALVVVDSHTGFVSCIPLEGKSQLDHANREIIKFVQIVRAFRSDFALRQ